jgi:hypothetical protein
MNALLGGLMGFREMSGPELEKEVAEVGGIPFRSDVVLDYLSSEELSRYLGTLIDEEYPESKARIDERTLVAFDLLGPGVHLRELRRRLLLENVAGFYDERPGKKRLYAVSADRRLTPANQVILAHELRHALQDQYVDVHALLPDAIGDFDDRRLAVMSLLEGDATLVMERFLLHHLPGVEEGSEPDLSGLSLPAPPVAGAPPVLRDQLVAPYIAGLDFARALYKAGGWAALKSAWQHPPESTDQVLHPDRYFAHHAARAAEISYSPSGGAAINDGVLGDILIRTLLEGEESSGEASSPEGWEGDHFRVFDMSGRTLLLWRSEWSSPTNRQAFLGALLGRFARTHGPGRSERGITLFNKPGWTTAVFPREGSGVLLASSDDPVALRAALQAGL